MVCTECNNEIAPANGFCPMCGAKLPDPNKVSMWIKAGLIFVIISIFFLPIIFGPLGVICGIVLFPKNKFGGAILILLSIIGMAIGLALGLRLQDIIINYDT